MNPLVDVKTTLTTRDRDGRPLMVVEIDRTGYAHTEDALPTELHGTQYAQLLRALADEIENTLHMQDTPTSLPVFGVGIAQ